MVPLDPLGRPVSPWWKRFLAELIDIVVLSVADQIVATVAFAGAVSQDASGTIHVHRGFYTLLGIEVILSLAYYSLLDGSRRGQTLGKMALGIAVRDGATGGQLGAGRALGRRFVYEFLYLLLLLPGVLNALSPLWDTRRQAWHDKLVGSLVVDVR